MLNDAILLNEELCNVSLYRNIDQETEKIYFHVK